MARARRQLSDEHGPLPLGEIPSDPSDFLESDHPGYSTPLIVDGVDTSKAIAQMDKLDPSIDDPPGGDPDPKLALPASGTGTAAAVALAAVALSGFNPAEARTATGQWTAGGGGATTAKKQPGKHSTKKQRMHRRRRVKGHEHAHAPAKVKTHLTMPELTAEQQAWVDAQGCPPELKPYLEAAVAYWGAHPDAVTIRWGTVPDGSAAWETTNADGSKVITVDRAQFSRQDALTSAILVTHEVGHSLGHSHAEGGIMDGADPYGRVYQTYPFFQELPILG